MPPPSRTDIPETDTLRLIPARSGKARPRAFFGLHQSIGAPGKRANMEDATFAGEITTAGELTLTLGIVADGIGGANAGERASALAVECILEAVREARGSDIPAILADGLRYANRSVFEEGLREASRHDMGSTATVAAVGEGRLYLASVGDSRAYLVRNGKALQITVDHSWEGEMVRAGRMSAAEAARAVHAKALMRSIGADREVEVDLGLYLVPGEREAEAASRQGMLLQPGDAVLLCSDGLIKERPDGRGHFVEAREIPGLIKNRTAASAAQALVQKAVSRRANDNVSAVVLGIPGGAGHALWRGLKFALAAVILCALGILAAREITARLSAVPAAAGSALHIGRVAGEAFYMPVGGAAQTLQAASALEIAVGGGLQTLAGTAVITLPDGTRLYLDRFSLVTLDQLADPQTGDRNTVITLARGRILLAAAVAPGSTVTVVTASGLRAQVLGTVLGLRYDAVVDRLEADCLEGKCLLANAVEVLQLAAAEGAWVSAAESGRLDSARYADFAALGAGDPLWITPSLTATATSTPTSTPRPLILPSATDRPAGAGPAATDTPTGAPSGTAVPTVVDTPAVDTSMAESTTEAPTVTPG